jgi:HupE/UreJ protein
MHLLTSPVIKAEPTKDAFAGAKEQRMIMRFQILAISIVGSSLPAAAHSGNSPANDFLTGLIHPLSGIDHLVPMIALGIWAAVMGGRSLWLLPMTFLSAMAMGGSLGQMNMPLPLTEPVIVASAVILSVFAVLRLRPMADRGTYMRFRNRTWSCPRHGTTRADLLPALRHWLCSRYRHSSHERNSHCLSDV